MVAYAKDTCTTPHWSSLDNATNGTINSSAFASMPTNLGAKPPDPCNNNNGQRDKKEEAVDTQTNPSVS